MSETSHSAPPSTESAGFEKGFDKEQGEFEPKPMAEDSDIENSGAAAPQKFYGGDRDVESQRRLSRTSTNISEEANVETDYIARVLTGGSRRSNRPTPNMGGGKDYPPLLNYDKDLYKVEFDGPDDPMHPHNWPLKKKLPICAALGFTTFTVAWGSAIFASAVEVVAAKYHVSVTVGILCVSLYVMGFASGPILWAPLSEVYGRKIPSVISIFGFMLFSFAAATSKDFQTLILCRFFGGFFGAAPLAVVAAAFADMFGNEMRGTAISIFSLMVFCGPLLAPVVGGFIVNSYLGWRWTEYITGIMAAVALLSCVFLYEETYHPMILVQKAKLIRKATGNQLVYAPHEQVEIDMAELVTKNLTRPIVMTVTEPIIFLISLYTAFIYGILYLCLEAYPIIFSGYKMKGGIVELPYLGLLVGCVVGGFVIALFFEPQYNKKLAANNGKPVPEARLPPMIAGGIAFPIGIFWLTWTGNYPESVHWAAPAVSGLFTGFGLICVFLPAINYIVDSYLFFAASALAGNTFMRSSFGAAFPLFAIQMFHNLGINWAGTLIGCLAVVLIPVPVLFYIYGKKLRQKSKFAFDL
ncbi:Tpo1p [Sugiyamaella lignohabitans]|uniref:Tpo1p n=1 Tax=Sugiyamaella lignohabitans TaxID=796027 RepID=A0A167CKS0_9ASCO|nr:Tpo1p [Sugiyamaella lignohabitans]ANB11822.1 Tpo1p [Sugiyamaella lignohabitans]